MNPNTGELFKGDSEFLKKIEERDGVKLVPITDEQVTLVEAMNDSQRKAFAKQERKRQARLAQVAKGHLASKNL